MSPTARFWRRHHTNALNIIMFLVAGAWLGCQVFLPATNQPPILNVVLQATFGAWLTNLAYEQRNKDEHRDTRIGKLEVKESTAHERLDELEATAEIAHGKSVIEVQRRELHANQLSLQLMREAVDIKRATGVPVLAETFVAMDVLERQIAALIRDIEARQAAEGERPPDEAGKHEST